MRTSQGFSISTVIDDKAPDKRSPDSRIWRRPRHDINEPLSNENADVIVCSRLSDSGEKAKVKGTRKVGGRREKALFSPVYSLFIFVFVLSQFSALDYLGAWNRLPASIIDRLF